MLRFSRINIKLNYMKYYSSIQAPTSLETLNYIKRKNLVQFFSSWNGNDIETNCEEMVLAAKELDPARKYESDEARKAEILKLEHCLKLLSHREKTAFYLFHYENLKQKEISEIMNTSVSAIESLIHKAKKKITKNIHILPESP